MELISSRRYRYNNGKDPQDNQIKDFVQQPERGRKRERERERELSFKINISKKNLFSFKHDEKLLLRHYFSCKKLENILSAIDNVTLIKGGVRLIRYKKSTFLGFFFRTRSIKMFYYN